MNINQYIVTYTTTTGYQQQRWCYTVEAAEELATYLLGCEVGNGTTNHGTICHTEITYQGQPIGEFEH